MTIHKGSLAGLSKAAVVLAALTGTVSAAASQPQTTAYLYETNQYRLTIDDYAWINDIGVLLYADPDRDNYFSGISLSIDADTDYNSLEVYVMIDIISTQSQTSYPMANPAAIERLHTTSDFDLYALSTFDEYRVDIDLVSNYSPEIYDLQITLADAHTDRILDQVGSEDFRNLRSLSLESEDNETVHIPVIDRPVRISNDNIDVAEFSGSTGLGLLALFLTTALFRIRSRLQVVAQ